MSAKVSATIWPIISHRNKIIGHAYRFSSQFEVMPHGNKTILLYSKFARCQIEATGEHPCIS